MTTGRETKRERSTTIRNRTSAKTLTEELLLTALWMAMHIRLGDPIYVDAFSAIAFLMPYLFILRYTSLKRRSLRTQSTFIGGMILVLTLILGTVGWIGLEDLILNMVAMNGRSAGAEQRPVARVLRTRRRRGQVRKDGRGHPSSTLSH